MTTKKCSVCKEERDLSMFYNSVTSKDCKGYRCKLCDTEARKKWERENADRARKSRRGRNLKAKYGITIEEYDTILEEQGGRCAICGSHSNESAFHTEFFAVDHCHETGRIRGLLCNNCNRALGFLKDDPVVVSSALTYLKTH